jgi:hypothetical protein
MRHAHDLLNQSKCRGDLGRGRQQLDDALHVTIPVSFELCCGAW